MSLLDYRRTASFKAPGDAVVDALLGRAASRKVREPSTEKAVTVLVRIALVRLENRRRRSLVETGRSTVDAEHVAALANRTVVGPTGPVGVDGELGGRGGDVGKAGEDEESGDGE